ncbi:MAG: hemerythrin family protein [Deltaproteobacteria bacterium]|nr:hemerythrin family protein [Deltaproteobacteria bacterium]
MAFMTWNDNEFSVNIKLFDTHHKKLFDLINRLHDAMKQGKARDVLAQILSELIDYTVYHFKAEEELFQKHGYPEYAQQKKEHKELTKTALELKAKFDKDQIRTVLTMETMKFLKDWLNNHICETDKKYTKFLNSKGVV